MAIVSSAAGGMRAASRATMLQLRMPNLGAAELEHQASKLVASSPVPVVVSSRGDVALACEAAGVHLPERDIPVHDARRLLGERLIGRSVHSREGAVAAEQDGADYVIYGPVWPSASHPDATAVGLDALAEVAHAVRIPVLAIGGIDEERGAECLRAGAAGYAGIGMFQ